MRWVPVLGFLGLGTLFLQKAVRANAKRSWAWGRGGSGPPLSRRSYAIWAGTFFSIGWVLSEAPEPSAPALLALLVSFLAVLTAGAADTVSHRRPRERDGTGAGSAPPSG